MPVRLNKYAAWAKILLLVSLPWLVSACSNVQNFKSETATIVASPTAYETAKPEDDQQPISETIAPPVDTIDIPAESLRGVLIHFWHPWSGSTQSAVRQLVEQFNLSNPWGILVTAVPISGYDALTTALNEKVNGVEPPDVLVGYLHQALEWDQNHPLLDLAPYLADPEWGLSQEEIGDFYPLFWENDQIEHRRLGIPIYRSAQLLVYNQSWAEELGFQSTPTTPEHFRQQTCAAAESYLNDDLPENNGMGGWVISTDPAVTLSWMGAFSGQIQMMTLSGGDQSIYQFNTPEVQRSLTYLRGLFDRGCSWMPLDTVPDLAFANRQAIIASIDLTDLASIDKAMQNQGNQDNWTALPFPSETGSPLITVFGPSYLALQGDPKEQLASWLFIRWLSSPENSVRIIETNGSFPPRKSTLEYMQPYANRHPQWGSAFELLEFAQNEPVASSWGAVRRSLEDAATQLYRSYFTIDQVETLLQYLDSFAAELHLGTNLDSVFASSTPTPGGRPTRTPVHTGSPTSEGTLPALPASLQPE